MKNMKKQLACSVLCLALLLIMMLGTTVAWFSDSASTNNTMVVGKISIEQTVQNETNQPVMMPTVKVDKAITVTNKGNQPCYARTLIAFEDKLLADGKTMVEYLDLGARIEIPGVNNPYDKVQFTAADGTVYTVGYYIHETALTTEEGGKSYTCLNSITLQAEAPNEWHEAAGTEYQILVLSQAVQTAGLPTNAAQALDQVFGGISANAENWFSLQLPSNP